MIRSWNVLIEMNWNYRYDLFDILIYKIYSILLHIEY